MAILINYLSVVAVMQPGLCSFSESVINVWNSLSGDITKFSSVKAFKRSLGAIDLSGFCTGSFYYEFVFSMFVFLCISLYFIL